MKLPLKQRVFVREYIKDRNATRAYIAAGYTKEGAAQSASRMLRNPKVKIAIDKQLARMEARIEYSAEKTLKRIAEIAHECPTARKSDILKACELLGKHFKLFTDVQEVSGKDGGPLMILSLPDNGRVAPIENPSNGDGKDNESKTKT